MLQIWLFFKILESIVGSTCMMYHAEGFMDNAEPLPHTALFCGTFFGFTLYSFLTIISIVVGASPPAVIEFVTNLVATVMYFMTSIVSMHNAEDDFHLMYLSDFEEPTHPYFSHSRAQSIAGLLACAIHLLHCVLAMDVLLVPQQPNSEGSQTSEYDEDDDDDGNRVTDERRPIKMYFFCKYLEDKLRKNEWFDQLCRRSSEPLTIYSVMPFSSRPTTPRPSSKVPDIESADKFHKVATSRSKVKLEKRRDTFSSEELRIEEIDYTDYMSPPQRSPKESRATLPLTRFNLTNEKSSAEVSLKASNQKTILKKKSDVDWSFAAAETKQPPASKEAVKRTRVAEPPLPTKQQQPLRTSSLEEINALLKGAPKSEEIHEVEPSTEEKLQVEPTTGVAPEKEEATMISKTESEVHPVEPYIQSTSTDQVSYTTAAPSATAASQPTSVEREREEPSKEPQKIVRISLELDKSDVESVKPSALPKEASKPRKKPESSKKTTSDFNERPSTSKPHAINVDPESTSSNIKKSRRDSKEAETIEGTTEDESSDYATAESFVHDENNRRTKKNKRKSRSKK